MDPTSQAFFDRLYRRSEDPWGFASAPYERARHDHLLRMLDGRTFDRGFEPGCSIGVLTRRLAERSRHLLATDISPIAVGRARRRCAGLPGVDVRVGRLPVDLPDRDAVDLVVLSEVGYYLSAEVLDGTLDALALRSRPGGLLVAAHWTGQSADHVLAGPSVHEIIDAHPALARRRSEEAPGYLVGSWSWR